MKLRDKTSLKTLSYLSFVIRLNSNATFTKELAQIKLAFFYILFSGKKIGKSKFYNLSYTIIFCLEMFAITNELKAMLFRRFDVFEIQYWQI